VEWYLGDTTQSIAFLEDGQVDVAVTYNEAAEREVYDSGMVSAWIYGFHVRHLHRFYSFIIINSYALYVSRIISTLLDLRVIRLNFLQMILF
jgi:hypothetical protein